MGNSATKETKNFKATQSNGKTINLEAEICSSWGFGGKVSKVESLIVKKLTDEGYDVVITLTPLTGGNGEYFLYVTKEDKKSIVFSNSKNHESQGAIYAGGIVEKNHKAVVDKIIQMA